MFEKIPIFIGEGGDRIQIGEGRISAVHTNGDLGIDLFLAGDWSLRSDNVAGSAQLVGYLPSALRKD